MKLALSLFLIFTSGKIFTLLCHRLPLNGTTPFVLLWQDALVAGAVGCGWKFSKRAGWILYSIVLLHFAVSMPLLRLMATPLTRSMIKAGGGTLADSILHHVDLVNTGLVTVTLILGTLLPVAFSKSRFRTKPWIVPLFAAAVFAGCFLTARSDLQGLHRNSLVAFASSYREGEQFSSRLPNPVWKEQKNDMTGRFAGRNLLLVALESTGARHLKCYGSGRDPMPFLTTLAERAVIFDHAYAGYPESIKGLLTVLASRQPEFGSQAEDLGPRASPSLATVCAEAGYETALFHSGRFMYLGMDEVVQSAGFKLAEDAGAIGGNQSSSFGVDDSATADRVLHWVDRRDARKPFFLHFLPIAGHHPYDSPLAGPFEGADDESNYLNALHYSDRILKKLFDGLEARAVLANTLVVIYGDHGEAFGEHPGNYGHTLYLYEENVRVPLILWAAEGLPLRREQRVTSLVDVSPTICDLLGLKSPRTFEGISAFAPGDRPAFFLTDYSMRLYGLRWDRWKFIHEQDTGFARLYDLEADPKERTNLAENYPEIVRDFREGLLNWSQFAKPSKLSVNSTTVPRQ